MPFIALSYALDNYLRICEKGVYAMWVGIFVVICNVVLVCLFVIWFEMGIFGAGLAISLGLSFGTILSVLPFFMQDLVLKFCTPKLTLKKFLGILYNGSSEFLGNISGSLLAIFANVTLFDLHKCDFFVYRICGFNRVSRQVCWTFRTKCHKGRQRRICRIYVSRIVAL